MNLSLDRKIYLMKLARQGVKITIPQNEAINLTTDTKVYCENCGNELIYPNCEFCNN